MAGADAHRLIVGAMTGTSIDGMDAALVEISGTGLGMKAKLRAFVSRPLGAVAASLRAAADQQPLTAANFACLMHDFALRHVEVIGDLLAEAGARGSTPLPSKLALVVVHGQTIYHAPPVSWQLINPAPIAAALGCPVMHDLRAADLAAGGQGAPITPLADWILFRSSTKSRAIVNLGGFCNITLLPAGGAPEDIRGYDCCACNQILDHLARRRLNQPYDDSGSNALAGRVHEPIAQQLRSMLVEQEQLGRSMGTGDEAATEAETLLRDCSHVDALATASAAIGWVVGESMRSKGAEEAYVAGGSSRHLALMKEIDAAFAGPIRARGISTTNALGIRIDAREAVAMAILGALSADGVPITLKAVTGRGRSVVSGSISGFRKYVS